MRNRITPLFFIILCAAMAVRIAGASEKPWKPGERIELVMAAGGVGGTYYPLAGGLAKLWKDTIPGVNVTVQATGASAANVRLLGRGEADLALVQNDVAEFGREGSEFFAKAKEKYRNYLALGGLYPEAVQIVARGDGPIRAIEDLKGKTVVVGAAGSGTELVARRIFARYGVDYSEKKDMKPLFLGFTEGAAALRDRSADALVIVAGVPNAALADVQTAARIRLLPVDVKKLEGQGFFTPFVVSAGAYKGLDSDVEVVALKATLVARDEINSQLVYELTKALFEKAETLGHAKAKEFDPNTAAQGVTIPFHPGAARFFKEKGVSVPTP
jgi:TRAP transporter TAXI family solute receptor